jgi:hypothetical protein
MFHPNTELINVKNSLNNKACRVSGQKILYDLFLWVIKNDAPYWDRDYLGWKKSLTAVLTSTHKRENAFPKMKLVFTTDYITVASTNKIHCLPKNSVLFF